MVLWPSWLTFSYCRVWLGVAKVLCILRHQGIQLTLAYSWARLFLVAGKGRGECFYFFCFFPFIPVSLSSVSLSFISSTISYISFLPSSGRQYKMILKSWHTNKPQHNQNLILYLGRLSLLTSSNEYLYKYLCHLLTTVPLELVEVAEWRQKLFHNQSPRKLCRRAWIRTSDPRICSQMHCRLQFGVQPGIQFQLHIAVLFLAFTKNTEWTNAICSIIMLSMQFSNWNSFLIFSRKQDWTFHAADHNRKYCLNRPVCPNT